MVDFRLGDEHEQFRDTVRTFVDKEVRPVARDWERENRYPNELVKKMGDMGLFGLTIPAEHGGIGADMLTLALVFEELSRGWMGLAGILGSHTLSTWMIATHGTDDQRTRYLPELASGVRRTAIALTEPDAGTDIQSITTSAELVGDTYVVNGTKIWITNARHADPLPVLVKTDPSASPAHAGMSVLLIEQGASGLNVSRDMGKLGYKGPESCEVQLVDVEVPAADLLGGLEGRGMQQVLSSLEVGRINVAARSVGIAQEAFDLALAYSKERRAFGKPISEFQAIQLKLATMATEVQAARLLLWWSATRADQGERVDIEAGMAKYFGSEVAIRNSLESMRVHGGMGYSTEFDVERLYRDAPLMSIGEGTNDIMRMVVAGGLLTERLTIG